MFIVVVDVKRSPTRRCRHAVHKLHHNTADILEWSLKSNVKRVVCSASSSHDSGRDLSLDDLFIVCHVATG